MYKQSTIADSTKNCMKQAWTAYYNNGCSLNETVMFWLGQLPEHTKKIVLEQMQSPIQEEE